MNKYRHMKKRVNNFSKDTSAGEQLTSLYDNYYKALVGYSMQIVVNEDVAKDIVQSIFQVVCERQADIDMRNEPMVKSYLYNSVRNKSINSLRRKKTEEKYINSLKLQYEEFSVSNGEENFFTEEIFRLLFKKIDALPLRQREVFLLCMEGKTYKEIGEALQISTETVKTQKHKAVSRLKEELGKMSFLLFLLAAN